MTQPAVATAERLRLLCIAPTFLPVRGGAERLLAEVLGRLALRHDITLLAPEPPPRLAGPMPDDLPYTICRYVERVALDRFPLRQLHAGYVPPFGLSVTRAAMGLARALHPDVVSVHYAVPTGLAGWAASRTAACPWVLSFVGRDVPGPDTPRGWGAWDRRLARSATDVTYISDYCRTAIFGADTTAPGATVGAGVTAGPPPSPQAVAALRAKLALPADATVLLAMQRLVSYKGVDVVLRAMARFADQPVVLLVAGDGPARPELERLAGELGLGEHVRWLGFVPEAEMSTVWGLCDVFVCHSYYETFGLALAEAMAAGKPVVAARGTALPEVAREGIDGLFAPPGDDAAFAAAIRTLVAQPDARRGMGEAGRERAASLFSWDAVADRYEHTFMAARTRHHAHPTR